MQTDYTKFVIDKLYVSFAVAKELLQGNYIPSYNYQIDWFAKEMDVPCTAYCWDLVNDDLMILPNTIVTPEDELARQCMLMPDNGVRLTYLNNL